MNKFKSWLGIGGAVIGISSGIGAFIILPYRVEAQQKQIDALQKDHDLLIEMRSDIAYIKATVSKLEREVEARK